MSLDPVQIVEVSPRDGLQNEKGWVETVDKLALIGRLVAMGATRIEVASFVNPRRVPQMADAEAVVAGLPDAPGVRYIGLCLNERGVDRAIASRDGAGRGLDEAGCVLVATDGFGIVNQGQTVADGIVANTAMLAKARAAGLFAQVTISAAFGCPYDGHVPAERVVELAARMADAGAQEIALADTIGVGVPSQVGDLVGAVIDKIGEIPIRLHLHDTRGLAPANAWAGYQAGCRVFDSALGGLGGCPFAPGAAGNVGTEELVYLFGRSGVVTGLDIDAAVTANHWFAGIMGRALPSRVGKAGDFTVKGATVQEYSV
ncbi:hydroxymethylglutaryl-CoA lyase [Sandarakinorhabdus sp. DWP1-3-1]|uniref:hydroxymethylglutaryl-CoA lyase n=1 Tax=Sandarakinorhabdus sp. DWP1-3-1 TaxID=2804627 RepID=UPI003CEB42E5